MKKIIIAILFCLGFNLSYADTTYYTFVMHKPTGTSNWQHFYNNERIVPGLYRFQIVMSSESPENKLTNWWYAIWGEFQFVDDPLGGVKIYARNTLNERNSLSSWTNITKNWTATRQKRLQPIIKYMKREEPLGYPDPNLMRFLILNRNTNNSWQWKNKTYHLYRLHYFDPGSMSQNEYKQAISNFINPNEAPTSDAEQLKSWLNNQEKLTLLAQHAGASENKYEELHEYFKTWFNDLLTIEEVIPEPIKKESSFSYWWLFILLVIIVLIYRNKKISNKIRFLWNKNMKMTFRKNIFLHSEQPMSTTSYLNKEEVELLKVEVKQLRVRIHKLEEQLRDPNGKLNQDAELKEVIADETTSFLNNQFNNDVNKTLELYAHQFWQEFIDKNTITAEPVEPDLLEKDLLEKEPNIKPDEAK